MAEIKIFVSHRIDIHSERIDNPLYVPIRCGAVFDQENSADLLGDDTGDNISERRMSFCEFTVQYWAWKNADADYYGLCHYRRFLSFADKRYRTDEYNMVYNPTLLPSSAKRYGLDNPSKMAEIIQSYDIILSEYTDIRNTPTPMGKKKTVYEHWRAHEGEFFERTAMTLLFELIDLKQPQFSKSAREYFSGYLHRGFNCYVMKKELFFRLCEFQFSIMFEVEKRLDTVGYTQTMMRTPAFLGEMLYGIFIYHILKYEVHKIKEVQLVFFNNTDFIRNRFDLVWRYLITIADTFVRILINPIFPLGSKRREFIKKIYYTLTPAKRRGVAAPK